MNGLKRDDIVQAASFASSRLRTKQKNPFRTTAVAIFAQRREGAKGQFLPDNRAAAEVARLGEDDFLKLLDCRCLDRSINPAAVLRHLP